MGVQSDRWIRHMALKHGMIKPFVEKQVREVDQCKIVSYGLSSYGYDIRISDHFKIFTNIHNCVIDPKCFQEDAFVDIRPSDHRLTPYFVMPPHSFALGVSVEDFRIPRDTLTLCIGKSTYARCGILVNVTPLEPEWEGQLTIEISNTTSLPVMIYKNEGIAQLVFFEAEEECQTSYADREGKYMRQEGITVPVI